MVWRVIRVEADDFMSYEHLDLDLSSLPGVTLVLGDRGPDRSNGSGKSTLLEVVAWTLYGETCRKLVSVDKVIRRGCKRCVGRVTVQVDRGGQGYQFVVERSRGPGGPSVRVAGLPGAATSAGTQSIIDATLGDRQSFVSTAMFTGAMSSFCRLPDSTRKELLERMAGCDSYAAAADLAKTRLDDLQAEVVALDHDLVRLQANHEHAVTRLQQEVSDSLTKRSRLIDEYIDAMEAAVEAHDRSMEANRTLREWLDTAAAERSKAEESRARYDAIVDAVQAEIDAIDKELARISAEAGSFRSRIKVEEDDINSIRAGRHADTCPKCGQRWPQDGDPVEIEKVVKAHQAVVLENRCRLAPLEEKVPELRSRRESLLADRQEAQRASRAAIGAFDERKYRTLLQTALGTESDLTRAHQVVQAAAEAIPEEPSTNEELKPLREAVEDAQDAVTGVREKLTVRRDLVRRLQFWRKGFGKTGLPSFLVDASIPDMNDVVHEVAQALTDGELEVSFNPAAAKGTQSVLAIEVDYANGGEGFDSSSHGEQTRVDVSVLFALRDLAQRRLQNPCGQLFLDEVMDGTDGHFVQGFMSLLRSRYKDLQVVLVSHDPAVASLCDTTLVAQKVGAVSSLRRR